MREEGREEIETTITKHYIFISISLVLFQLCALSPSADG